MFTVLTNGNVGIGTSTPSQALTVNGNLALSGAIFDSTNASGTAGMILESTGTSTLWTDTKSLTGGAGYSWTAQTAPGTSAWSSVVYGDGKFVAVSYDGHVMNSSDGINWATSTSAEANSWTSVTYGNGLFVAVASSGTHQVMISKDGINWTLQTAVNGSWNSVTYGDGKFVAIAAGLWTMSSPDGINWTLYTVFSGDSWDSITYGNGLFVAVSGGGHVAVSNDGINWTQTSIVADGWQSIAYGNGLFVAVASGGDVETSPDGINWTAQISAIPNSLRSIAYGNGLFVVVTNSLGSTNQVMTSPDGMNWTVRSSAEANTWNSVAYGNGTFVAVSQDGTHRAMSSGETDSNIIPTDNIYQGGMNIFGYVGIGTTTPSQALTVNGNLSLSGAIFDSTNASGTAGMILQSTGTSTLWTINSSPSFAYASSSYLLYSSSTEVLNSANFAPVSIPSAVTYDTNTLAVYNFENNGNDSISNYNLTPVGTGPVFQTDLIKQGSYSESVQVGNGSGANYDIFPNSLMTTLGSESQWTIEGWVYLSSVRSPSVWSTFITNNWATTTGDLAVELRTDSPDVCFGYAPQMNSCGYDPSITTDAWHFVSVQWDGSNAKLYIDSSLVGTIASSINIFASPIGPMVIGNGTTYSDSYNTNSRIDKMIVSNVVRNGVETDPTIGGYFTPQIFADASGTLFAKNAIGTISNLNSWVTNGNNTDYLLGNVGIGTDAPSSALTVIGSTTISSLSSGFVKATASGELYTDPNTYSTEGENDNLSYRYNTDPLLYWSGAGPQIVKNITVPGAENYGAWDGQNFWTTNFYNSSISKVNANGVVLATYTFYGTNPIQAVYDGKNIWVASANGLGTLIKFNPTTLASSTYITNPGSVGSGGIQGIVWDGKNIWIGIAGINTVAKVDPSTGAIIASTTGQYNVNGMAITNIEEASGTVEYIWAANTYGLGKIKASDLSYTTYPARQGSYRIATDGTYIYDSDWFTGKIDKYLASDGSLVDTWQGETGLNTIAFDGKYVWTGGGGPDLVEIFDRDNGTMIDSIPDPGVGTGLADLIFDGSYMWAVVNGTSSSVMKISIGNQMGNLKVAQSLSIMDDNANTALFLSGTSSQNSFMLSNFGIGTTSASSVLTISGTPTSTLMRLVGFGSGALMTDANGVVYDNSDERLKDIAGTSTIGLSAIEGLNPINYHWNATSGLDMVNEYTGFSAQNVQANIPNAVGTDSKGYLTLDDRPIVAALVNSVKEIGSFITKVENGIAYLTNIVVERLTVGSTISPEGITMYDTVTKQPYCVSVSNGSLVNKPGDCSSYDSSTSTSEMESLGTGGSSAPDIISTSSTSSVDILTSTSSSETSTSTEATSTSSTATTTQATSTPSSDGTATSTATSTPADTTPPVITINGDNPTNITAGDTYTDAGATALDDIDGTVPVLTSGAVDSSTAGTYTITYTASDSSGNTSTAERIVNVAPVQTSDDSATSSDATSTVS